MRDADQAFDRSAPVFGAWTGERPVTQEQLIPLIALAVVIPLVLLRNRRPRTLRPRFMWIVPLLVVAVIGAGIWAMSVRGPGHAPVEPMSLLILAVGLALGCAFGWQRGRMTTIFKEPDGTLKAPGLAHRADHHHRHPDRPADAAALARSPCR